MRAIDRWRRLNREQRLLTLRSAAAVAFASLLLRIVSVTRLLHAVSVPLGQGSDSVRSGEWVTAMDRAGRYVPGATCLAKSVALCWILRRRGLDVVVRIGARRESDFSAHAWIERDGQPLTSARDDSRIFTAVLSTERFGSRH